MRARTPGLAATGLAILLAACASPERTSKIDTIDQFQGYRYVVLEEKAPKSVDKAAVILTFSGGGTRAAALADGALRALAETQVRGRDGRMVPLASQIDLISSVSGGSVTAAWFALHGIDGLYSLERDFLKSDIMERLIFRTLINPLQLFQPRIDILDSYLDEAVFAGKTYGDLLAATGSGRDRRPYVVLNAADVATGSTFSFTQDQFDLICANLAAFKLADAVSASAAFPVALSALTLKNHSPCPAQRDAAAWQDDDGGPTPLRLINDRDADLDRGVNYPIAQNLARFRRATVGLTYLNRDARKNYVQLLDGGIADNLGLTVPLTLLTSANESPSFLNWANTGRADKLLLVVVNARSESANDYGTKPTPPSTFDTLFATIGTPIDATTFQLLGKLDRVIDERFNPKSVVLVDFDFIADRGCRTYFRGIATSWTLAPEEVDDLIALGQAMVLQSPAYQRIVGALNGTVPTPPRSVEQICAGRRAAG